MATSDRDPSSATGAEVSSQAPAAARGTRTRVGAAWVGIALAVVLAIAVLIFIIQNSQAVRIDWLGLHVRLSLAVALLLAAVGGALVVMLVGSARIAQLRLARRRAERGNLPPPSGEPTG